MTFRIYVAGPLFSEAERAFLEKIVANLKEIPGNIEFSLPHKLCNDVPGIFGCNMVYLRSADMVLAWLDGSDVDSGTAFEIGFAYCKGTDVIGYITDKRFDGENINKMIWGACGKGELIFDSLKDLAKEIVRVYNKDEK